MVWLRLASLGIAWLRLSSLGLASLGLASLGFAWFGLASLRLPSLGSVGGNWMVYCRKLDGLLMERMLSINGNSPADFLHF